MIEVSVGNSLDCSARLQANLWEMERSRPFPTFELLW